MLRQRVITAVILLLALIGALAAGRTVFAAAMSLVVGAAAYEWARLAAHAPAAAVGAGVALGALLFGLEVFAAWPRGGAVTAIVAAAVAAWVLIALLLVRAEHAGIRFAAGVKTVLGAVLLVAAWAAAMQLYRDGVLMLFSAAAVVWIADIAAYFAGRAFGKRKLAPHISPGKTWAGVAGAMIAVLASALVLAAAAPQLGLFSTWLLQTLPLGGALLVLVLLVALSIVGDLFESLLKRQAGVKDSSGLLPGHGGVLDRIDALLPVLPAAALLRQLAT
ncbi:MAG: phosphatidate cytidylyltransferase [Burkholderiaceae bacterium]|nr:phosphatidate cytidylyltransferase [Burkholderiaceae bacterium]